MARATGIEESVLLERAMHAFWANGYDGTSIRDLEVSLGLRAPAIYHRFESKQALFLRVLDHYVETVVVQRLAAHLGASDDAIANLLRFFESAMSASEAGRPAWGCLLTNTATELGSAQPRVAERVREGLERIRRAFQSELVRAASERPLERSPEELSHLLLIDFEGLDVLARLGVDERELQGRVRMIFARYFENHGH